jgi:adenosyl cobinamide kinase/adenosyl cobinamide phosphate guanylyltransferase
MLQNDFQTKILSGFAILLISLTAYIWNSQLKQEQEFNDALVNEIKQLSSEIKETNQNLILISKEVSENSYQIQVLDLKKQDK